MSSSVLIDLDNQSTSDEICINYSKVDLVKNDSVFIYHLFKTSIEYGEIVKESSKKSSTKDMKQWLSLFGEEANRAKTKKYITALCEPEYIRSVDINDALVRRLEKDRYKNELIKSYQIHLSILNDKEKKLIIQGALSDVSTVKCIIDLELNKINLNSKNKEAAGIDEPKNKAGDIGDDDIIWINDPYEMFDQDASAKNKKPSKSKLKTSDEDKEINKSFQNLNFLSSDDNTKSSSNTTEASLHKSASSVTSLTKAALSKGHDLDDIEKALNELSTNIGEFEFLEYLRMMKNFNKNPTQGNKNERKKDLIQKTASVKSNLSPSVVSNEPVSKKLNLSNEADKNDDDCLFIEFKPSDGAKSKPSKNAGGESSSLPSQNKTLNEYAKMIQKPFDEENEKVNKVKRISKLISAMPDEQKITALHEVNNRMTATTNNSVKSGTEGSISDDKSSKTNIAQLMDINVNKFDNFIKPSVPQNKDKFNFHYDPTLYQDDMNGLFSNFSDYRNSNKMDTDSSDNERKASSNPNAKNKNNNNRNSRKNNKKGRHESIERNNNTNREQRAKSSNPRFNSYDRFSNNNKQNNKANTNSNAPSGFVPPSYFADKPQEHGKDLGNVFSCMGIKIVVEFFLKRGHTQIKAMVPRYRRGTSDHACPSTHPEILDELENKGYITYTPSRYVNNKLILPYDDRFILNAAEHYNAVIVSNDNYRDLMQEKAEWRRLVESNLLQYLFVGDLFMIADDPMGRRGPSIDEFLSVRPNNQQNSNNNKNNNRPSVVHSASAHQPFLYNSNANSASAPNFKNGSNPSSYNNNNKNKNPNGPSKQIRSVAQTSGLYSKLIELFPDQDAVIMNLLNLYPNEYSENFFASHIIDRMDIYGTNK